MTQPLTIKYNAYNNSLFRMRNTPTERSEFVELGRSEGNRNNLDQMSGQSFTQARLAVSLSEDSNSSSMNVNSETEKSLPKRNSAEFGECRVCTDKANGVHYGLPTCEGCKVRTRIFGRTYPNELVSSGKYDQSI
jgi:hypothetical protein